MTTLEEGTFLVKLARSTIVKYITDSSQPSPPAAQLESLGRKSGVFVTIEKLHDGEKVLRGCIGYPLPYMPLVDATMECAVCAAVNDPRFPPLKKTELKDILVEVSVLTQPNLLDARLHRDYPAMIKVGRDGLIVESDFNKGLLLPQVPVEYGWDEETFLSQCCMKAGLPLDCWLSKETKVYTFTAEVFSEIQPDGEVRRKDFS